MDAFVEKDRVHRREEYERRMQEQADAIAARNAELAAQTTAKKKRHINDCTETVFLMIDVVMEVRWSTRFLFFACFRSLSLSPFLWSMD